MLNIQLIKRILSLMPDRKIENVLTKNYMYGQLMDRRFRIKENIT